MIFRLHFRWTLTTFCGCIPLRIGTYIVGIGQILLTIGLLVMWIFYNDVFFTPLPVLGGKGSNHTGLTTTTPSPGSPGVPGAHEKEHIKSKFSNFILKYSIPIHSIIATIMHSFGGILVAGMKLGKDIYKRIWIYASAISEIYFIVVYLLTFVVSVVYKHWSLTTVQAGLSCHILIHTYCIVAVNQYMKTEAEGGEENDPN